MAPSPIRPLASPRLVMGCLLGLLAGSVLCGCSSGGKLVPVTGVVKMDGQSVEGAVVIFWSTEEGNDPTKKGYGRAVTDSEGKYVVKDLYGKDGLFVGEYKVTFNRYVDSKGKLIASESKPEEVFGAKDSMPKLYQALETTTQVARIPSGGAEIVFDLRSK